MSRFSTVGGAQHSALRDLERQRLERMMGQLRKEVNAKDGECRFAPPRRPDNRRKGSGFGEDRGLNARVPGSRGQLTRSPVAGQQPFSAEPATSPASEAPSSARGKADDVDSRPEPDDDDLQGPGDEALGITPSGAAPSAEMAWLLRCSERMDKEAAEVSAFLARHDLDRYASLLVADVNAPGNSLDALRQADDTSLASVGIPESPRRRLRAALQSEFDEEVEKAMASRAPASSSSRPASSASTQGRVSPDFAPDGSEWKKLGRLPKGWAPVARPSSSAGANGFRPMKAPVEKVDCCVGDDDVLAPEDTALDALSHQAAMASLEMNTGVGTECAIGTETAVGTEVSRPPSSLVLESVGPSPSPTPSRGSVSHGIGVGTPSMQQSAGLAARPYSSSAAATDTGTGTGSRPGTASGIDKVYCYECYRQMHRPAVEFDEAGSLRPFCGEACLAKFSSKRQAQEARERRLQALRDAQAVRVQTPLGKLCMEESDAAVVDRTAPESTGPDILVVNS